MHTIKKLKRTIVFILKLALFASLFGIFFGIFGINNPWLFNLSRTTGVTMVTFVVLGIALMQVYGGYAIGTQKSRPIVHSMALATIITDLVTHLQLSIMNTSEKNNDETIRFFEEHDYFGYPKEDVAFFVQEMAAAVDFDGKLLLEAPGRLATSPNGNGGWFSSLVKAGLLSDIHQRGVEWINIFAVDNVLQRIADPLFIGATILNGKVSGSKVVRKVDAYEKMGVLCLEDGRPSVVEYYEMSKDMAESTDEAGNLRYAFGVILNYLFRVDKLEEIVERELPVHVVEKKIPYLAEDGTLVKPEEPNGYKFETLVVDMIRMMDNNLPFEVVREREFAPIKNLHGVDSLDSARELLQKNGIEL